MKLTLRGGLTIAVLSLIPSAVEGQSGNCTILLREHNQSHSAALAGLQACKKENQHVTDWGAVKVGACAFWGPRQCEALAVSCSQAYDASIARWRECLKAADEIRRDNKITAKRRLDDKILESSLTEPGRPELLTATDQKLLSSMRTSPGVSAMLGVRSFVASFGADAVEEILQRTASDSFKIRLLQDIIRRGGLMEELYIRFRKEVGDGAMTPERRGLFVIQLGELYNRNDYYLHFYFKAEIYKIGHVDGTVVAEAMLKRLEREMEDERVKEAANRLYKLIQSSDSAYKHLTLNEIRNALAEGREK